jgi:uncharacterized repeat protein (TIGR01451 family)
MKSDHHHYPLCLRRTGWLLCFLCLPVAHLWAQVSIGGMTWHDQNRNGIREASERSFSGVTVHLLQKEATGTFRVAGQYLTESDGSYMFVTGAGEYVVQFEQVQGYSFTQRNVGTLIEYDSDVDPATGQTALLVLSDGSNQGYINAGYVQTGGADLDLTISTMVTRVLVGESYTYTIHLVNKGPDKAFNVVVLDGLSSVAQLINTLPAVADTSERPLRWLLAEMAVGQIWTAEVTVRAIAIGVDDSRSCAATTSNDPDPANNCAELPIDVEVPVEISSFTAKSASGSVLVQWITESETENAGFYLYRGKRSDGPYEPLHAKLIEGQGTIQSRNEYEYHDTLVQVGETYYYKLADLDYSGRMEFHGPIAVEVTPPQVFSLQQNYPNPFNAETRIPFVLPDKQFVSLEIYSVLGQKVRTVLATTLPMGEHVARWDGLDDQGYALTSGMYLFVLQSGNLRQTRKMHLIR